MDPLSAPGEGAQRSPGNQRLRASTFSTPTTPRLNLDRVDSSSDPGHGYYTFSNSSTEPQTVPIEHLRPVPQGSTTSRNEARRSYTGTSSATQSFVSMDSRSGPTDTPHPSTHSVHTLSAADDSDGETEGSTPPGLAQLIHPPIESGDDTVRQPVPAAPRSTFLQPSDIPLTSIQKPITTESHNLPAEAPGSQPPEVPGKAEAVHSETAETPGPMPWINYPQQVASSSQGHRVSTSSRHESMINARPLRPSDATISPTNHPPLPPLPPEPRKSAIDIQRLSSTPIQSPPPTKAEQEHSSTNGAPSADALRPPLPSNVSQMDTQYVNMLLALDGIPVCLILTYVHSTELIQPLANPQHHGVILHLDFVGGFRAISWHLHKLAGREWRRPR